MNKKSILKNFSYTFIANMVSLLVSLLLIIFVPKFIGVKEYGYWQLYVFYTTYVSYMSFGISDGFYLRHGGREYDELDKESLSFQYWFMVIYNVILDIAFVLTYMTLFTDANKLYIIISVCVVGVMVVPKSLIAYSLQGSNRIKEFAIMLIIEKMLYFILVVLLLVSGKVDFQYYIIADIIGKLVSVIYGIFKTSDFVFYKFKMSRKNWFELVSNFKVGILMLISNLSSLLIVGIVRMFIEKKWGIEEFGKVSLTLSITNMMMVFVSAISVVLFPILRKLNVDQIKKIYAVLRDIITIPLLGAMLFYFPFKSVLVAYLPAYKVSVEYMALILPIIVFESKSMMLIVTYLKTLREEKALLVINVFMAILSLVSTITLTNYFHSIELMIVLITVLLMIRCLLLEVYLSKVISCSIVYNNFLILLVSIIFIYSSYFIKGYKGFFIFLITYSIYLVINRKNINSAWKFIKHK
ncbi:MATE family efflux transporter [Vagococcus fessus]|uniref:Polysaccharide biosynthesis protein C-terminal domain-containing protein n=1 Tax=Vagococcus fessus TaxID=120370 RepID=A0A430A864_9ENTE|nr:hypothetical protein [Vagococcus fessus]RSU03261.1 hypothetical protein CBF31_05970 [Vagococcus fessus]